MLGVVGFLATALYWPGVSGAATTPRWSALFLLVPWIIRGDRIKNASPYVWGGAFFLYAVASLCWTPQLLDGIQQVFLLMILASLFWFGSEINNPRPLYVVSTIGVSLSSAVALLQFSGFHPVPDFGPDWAPSGLFVNPNFLAEAAALLVVAAAAERMWWALPILAPALILPQARGAILAVAVAALVKFRSVRWLIIAGIALALSYVAAHMITDYGSSERLAIWQSAVNGLTVVGHGIGSFWSSYPPFDLRVSPNSYPEHAHNELLHIAFELGLPGVICALGFCLSLCGPLNTPRLVLIAFLTEACLAFPTHLPATAAIGLILAGYAVRDRYLLRDSVLFRRVCVRVGSALGGRPGVDAGGSNISVRSSISRRAPVTPDSNQ